MEFNKSNSLVPGLKEYKKMVFTGGIFPEKGEAIKEL